MFLKKGRHCFYYFGSTPQDKEMFKFKMFQLYPLVHNFCFTFQKSVNCSRSTKEVFFSSKMFVSVLTVFKRNKIENNNATIISSLFRKQTKQS